MGEEWIDVVVERKWQEAAGITCFEFVSPSGAALPTVRAGDHVNVRIASDIVRQYSLCQPPASPVYQIGVLRDPKSRGGSVALIERFSVGDTLAISAPANNFRLNPEANHSVLIAGGIGITPILAMADELYQEGKSFELHYGSRSPATTAFVERLEHAAYRTNVHHRFEDAEGRLDLSAILSDARPDAHVYVCGPSALIDAVVEQADKAGWLDMNVHRESFGASIVTKEDDQEFEVEAAQSQVVVKVGPGQSISSALLEAGIAVTTFCEQGVCGSCLTSVIEGVPDHRDQFLNAEERASNQQMIVCCSRAKTTRLVLDL
ncbi:PDR/VanB family oxidoreductase [Paraburkholderia tropica]|uniref:PDR/VanB family oxidoreductase n=1 Tax=Paraburkholderia tropica TaxID=92647 RepID=UPI002AB7BFA6|nr:PDR/VanB family oxidoreductase [Paraburkholderia tropica]